MTHAEDLQPDGAKAAALTGFRAACSTVAHPALDLALIAQLAPLKTQS